MMPRLFTKFSSPIQKGAVLALFISRSIVETHLVVEYEQGVTKTKNEPQLLFNFQVADNKILNQLP
jgi:hypothetical protein